MNSYDKVLHAIIHPQVFFKWNDGHDATDYPAEISTRVEGKVQALARLIRHELGLVGKPSLKRLRWTGPVFRDDGSSVYIRIFDNQIIPPCEEWVKELKERKYVIGPVAAVIQHRDFIVLPHRTEYRTYECSKCVGAFHIAKTWMWYPIKTTL